MVGIQGQGQFGTINSAQFGIKNIETLTGRLGYAVAPAVLAYVRGGAARASANGAAIIPGGLAGESANFTATGYTIGAGLEWMFAPGWTAFGEYDYLDLGTKNVNFASTGAGGGLFGAPGALADTNAVRLAIQTVTVGVNYRFNWQNRSLRDIDAEPIPLRLN